MVTRALSNPLLGAQSPAAHAPDLSRTERRLGAISGLAYLVTILGVGIVLGGSGPVLGDPVGDYGAFVAGHTATPKFWGAVFAEGVALLLSIFFLTALYAVIRGRGRSGAWAASAALSAGLISTVVKLAAIPVVVVAVDRGTDLRPDLTTALFEANAWAFVLTFGIDAAFLAAASLAILQTNTLPRWLGWAAAGIAPLLLVAVVLAKHDVPLLLLYFAWVLAACIALIRTPRRSEEHLPVSAPGNALF